MLTLQDFIDYFLNPTKEGYTISKTLTYAIVLVVAVYAIYCLLRKLKVKIDRKLAVSISPYVVFGATIRVLQDSGLLNSVLFVTPGVYFFVFMIVFSILLVSLFIERKKGIPYFKILFFPGLFLSALSLSFIKPVNFEGMMLVLTFYLPWVVVFYLTRWNLTNKIVTLVHMFDATTTFVALNFYGFVEQHVVPTLFINMFGPASFIFVKLITIVSILILIDKFSNDKEFNNYLKLVIGILGGATGSRDFIALSTLIGYQIP